MKTLQTMTEPELQQYCKACADAIERTTQKFGVELQGSIILLYGVDGGNTIECISDAPQDEMLEVLLEAAKPLAGVTKP